MTELSIDREKRVSKAEKLASAGLTVLLMVLLMLGSVSLLEWAYKHQISYIKPVEMSELTAAVREKQLACLAKNIYHEAGSEPFEGKIAVAQVTVNRTESGDFPRDICKAIYQKNVAYERVICQFSWVCDRAIVNSKIAKTPEYKESMEAAKQVLLEGFRLRSIDEALYYHADYVNPHWGKEQVAKIGHHIFYK